LPAYGFYLAFIASLHIFGWVEVPLRDWIAAVTFTMNFQYRPAWEVGHLWSLSIEEHYYLLWPLALALLSKRNGIRLLTVLLLVQPIIRWIVVLRFPAWSSMTDLWTFTRFDSIAAGSLLALLSRDDTTRIQLDRVIRWWPLVLAVLIVGLGLGMISAKLLVGVTPSTTAISLSLLVWTAARRSPRILETRFMVAVGLGSYSLYLWQQVFLNPHSTHGMAHFPLNVILACLAAWISFTFIEQPFLRLKERRRARPTPSPTYSISDLAESHTDNVSEGEPNKTTQSGE
jgi:peptidoglycan/LPS O-acetylase OafA/YrhL